MAKAISCPDSLFELDGFVDDTAERVLRLKNGASEEDRHFCTQVIEYLNQKADTSYQVGGESSQALILDLKAAGYGLADFYSVIDKKTLQWKNDPTYCQFLRPKTLFNKEKFENYVGAKTPAPAIPTPHAATSFDRFIDTAQRASSSQSQ